MQNKKKNFSMLSFKVLLFLNLPCVCHLSFLFFLKIFLQIKFDKKNSFKSWGVCIDIDIDKDMGYFL